VELGYFPTTRKTSRRDASERFHKTHQGDNCGNLSPTNIVLREL
jgi:hypothetical protein